MQLKVSSEKLLLAEKLSPNNSLSLKSVPMRKSPMLLILIDKCEISKCTENTEVVIIIIITIINSLFASKSHYQK